MTRKTGRTLAVALGVVGGTLLAAEVARAQIPAGVAVSVTNPPATTQVVPDAVTGLPQIVTSRTVILDVKHDSTPVFNACTDELVTITGKTTMWLQVNESSSGRVSSKYHQEQNGTGRSDTGVHYSYGGTADWSDIYGGPSLTTVHSETVENHLIRQGESFPLPDDFFIKMVFHFTVVNNIPTATVEKIEYPCR